MSTWVTVILVGVVVALIVMVLAKSFKYIGPTDVGLVVKRFGRRLSDGSVLAMKGEAGFQHQLLMPGWRVKFLAGFSHTGEPRGEGAPGGVGGGVAPGGAAPPGGAEAP